MHENSPILFVPEVLLCAHVQGSIRDSDAVSYTHLDVYKRQMSSLLHTKLSAQNQQNSLPCFLLLEYL